LPLEQISARGAGLYLMRKMMDEIDFDYDPQQGNKLRMVKRKSSAK
jgi:anti-sigma regulatory factor (Ser/Thr protein kinase)